MIITKKQANLFNDIVSPYVPELSVLGSTQSGKTYIICQALIQYAQRLNEYEIEQRQKEGYIPRKYYGGIIGWTTDTLKSNIVENLETILTEEYHFTNGKEYILKFGNGDKYFEIYGVKFFFFGFNTYLAFNKILGKPLIFVWVDESARIYTSTTLRETYDEIDGRMMSFAGHPYFKKIESYNVEGGQNHPFKKKYIDNRENKKYCFYPYDNPTIDTEEKMQKVVEIFPKGNLRDQKLYCKWVTAEGKVFNHIPIISQKEFKEHYIIREIGIGCDYGSVNPTTFCGLALCQNTESGSWELVLIDNYYHDPKIENDIPTTEYYSNQLKEYITLLQDKYKYVPVNTLTIDSEASHFCNRLESDGIRYEKAKKNNMSVDESVQLMQSLFYKGILKVLDINSIRYFQNGAPIYKEMNIGLDELETYHYDKLKSETSGVNTYVKDYDHYVDGSRYIIMEFKLSGRCPVV